MKHAALIVLLVTSLCMLSGALTSGARAEGEELWVPGELIVKFKPGQSASQKAALISGSKIDDISFIGAEVWRVVGQSVEDAVFALNSSSIVEYAEPNYLLFASGVPNDPDFLQQWNMHNTGQTIANITGVDDADIDAPEAWDLYTGDSSVVVAVIDSGVDFTHPDLAANIWHNAGEIPENSIDDDVNGYIDDVQGWNFFDHNNDVSDIADHGTHCAGVIGAKGNNGSGIAGVNWGIRIMPIRFMNLTPMGIVGPEEEAVKAIGYAVKMGADVINASWGGPSATISLRLAIQKAHDAGVFFVAAAGNANLNIDDNISYPANFDIDSIISVMATDSCDERAGFSNYGARNVDIAAPGVNIYSTVYAVL